MKDITSRTHIAELVDAFYAKVKSDEVIGYLFNDVAKVNWPEHLPKMYDFWENIIFYTGNYNGNPMAVHRELHAKSTMSEEHFARWLKLFTETVDEHYDGEKASEIKHRAKNIASVMQYKTIGPDDRRRFNFG